jgi:hypothetical protein
MAMPIETPPHAKNIKYLKVKKDKLGHMLKRYRIASTSDQKQ